MKKISPAGLVLSSVLFFLLSCSDSSKRNDELLSMLSDGLDGSTKIIKTNSEQILHTLEKKLSDPATMDKAAIWLPMAKQIFNYTEGISAYLNKLKQQKILDNDQARELYKKLIQYRKNVLATDSAIRYTFEKNITLISKPFDTNGKQEEDFYKTLFKNTSHQAFIAILNRLQNNVKTIENKMLAFCNAHIISYEPIYGFAALAVADKNYLKPGEFIEITAGVGGFSTQVHPEFTINRINVKMDNSIGAAQYKMKVPQKPGNYSVPVKILYTDPNGYKQEFQTNINYTVAKECDQ